MASNIKVTSVSGLLLSAEINENVEMSTSISVIFSSDDTLCSKA
jgi:hypothetical protein